MSKACIGVSGGGLGRQGRARQGRGGADREECAMPSRKLVWTLGLWVPSIFDVSVPGVPGTMDGLGSILLFCGVLCLGRFLLSLSFI